MCTDGHGVAAAAAILEAPSPAWTGEVIPLEPVDALSVLIVCDNFIDGLLVDQGPARRLPVEAEWPRYLEAPTLEEGRSPDAPVANHGFSALVTIHKAGTAHRLLFDCGLAPDGCVENMRRMGVDITGIEAIVCSHGHDDHTTGLSGLVAALPRGGTPVLIHPEFWTRRRMAIPGRDPIEMPTTSRRGLTDGGFEIIEQRQPSFLFQRSALVTGEVDRTTDFERGDAWHEAQRDGRWEPDPLILDDQALVVHVRGKGLIVLTGCGHAGIVNIVRYARRLTGVDAVHAVIGGFHLSGPLFDPIIPATVEALVDLDPDVVVPAHCTGWKAVHTIAAHLPDAFIQTSVGTTFELIGEPGAAAP
jgi:7,8-dihydropterin-6-yl-methyl-4-(beta-D-ribofuranosyl)aminobenzene 5'-phosphate synthase